MSVTGQLTQISQIVVERAKYTPSVIKLFQYVASSVNESFEIPRIKSLKDLSAERIDLLREIFLNPEVVVGRWTLYDLSELEFWKTLYPKDYERVKVDIDEIIEATRINRTIWLNRAWDIVNYIFTGQSSDKELAFLVRNAEDIPQINLFWGGSAILASNGEIEAHYLEHAEVREVAEALLEMSEQKIRYRFEQGLIAQADIYHFSWREQSYEWLLQLCINIKEFYADAASRGHAILINID